MPRSSISAALAHEPLSPAPSPSDRHRLLLWHWGRHGGGPLYTHELSAALRSDPRFDLHLSLSRHSELREAFAGLDLPVHWVDTYRNLTGALWSSMQLPAVRRAMRSYLEQAKIDTVLCTMPHLWNVALLDVIREAGARFITTIHDAEPHPGERVKFPRPMLAREVSAADHVITLTHYVRDRLVNRFGLDPARVSVAAHGVFGAETRPLPKRPDLTNRPLRLLFFGRIMAYKGIETLLDAYEGLRQEGRDVTLTIAGAGDLGPHRRQLARLPDLRLENRWIESAEIGDLFAAHDLVVLPYVEASQSGVVAFAYGAGLPVVATPVGGLPEQIQHLRSGVVARRADAPALADAIRMFLVDPDLYARCTRGAERLAHSTFAWPRIAGSIAELVLQPAPALSPVLDEAV